MGGRRAHPDHLRRRRALQAQGRLQGRRPLPGRRGGAAPPALRAVRAAVRRGLVGLEFVLASTPPPPRRHTPFSIFFALVGFSDWSGPPLASLEQQAGTRMNSSHTLRWNARSPREGSVHFSGRFWRRNASFLASWRSRAPPADADRSRLRQK